MGQKQPTRSDTMHAVVAPRAVVSNGSRTLGAQRLQGLFHSLSKVLCIFRSHYLFAIGLGALFSLRRTYTCAWHSTIKLRDSWKPRECGPTVARRPTHAVKTDDNGTVALLGSAFQRASSACAWDIPLALALQFHRFRFLPRQIQ